MINNILAARGLSDIKPVKLNKSKMAFKQMEIIGLYLERTKLLGIKSQETFQTVDLYEGKNMLQVIDSIFALSRHTWQYGFPLLGKFLSLIFRAQTRQKEREDLYRVAACRICSSGSFVSRLELTFWFYSLSRVLKLFLTFIRSIRQVYDSSIPVGDTTVATKLMVSLFF
jgi:hypothetical protein